MTPADQTKFYEPDAPPERQRGNCLSAVIASLLDLPIEAVPNFVQEHVNHHGDDNHKWNWFVLVGRFLHGYGWALHSASVDTHGEHLWVSGKSPRADGIYHAVIYKDGVMVHDPHPDRTGILNVENAYGLHRIDDETLRA